jgi:hypothetical protein
MSIAANLSATTRRKRRCWPTSTASRWPIRAWSSFQTGMRKGWNKNVVAVGLSSGFLEPLESTSIHLIQSAIARLINFFPDQGFSQIDIDEYNRQSRFEYERVRDFVILHYKVNQRTDSEFWKMCAAMPVPATLQYKLDLFKSRGRVVRTDNELFAEVGWLQVMYGQNLLPDGYNPLVDLQNEAETMEYLDSVSAVIQACVGVMPDHAAYIARFCLRAFSSKAGCYPLPSSYGGGYVGWIQFWGNRPDGASAWGRDRNCDQHSEF